MHVQLLPRVVAAPETRPVRAGVRESQARSRAIARDPSCWTATDARDVMATYEQLAPTWDDERGAYRPTPVRDALARGGPMPDGLCVEMGSGTGLLTPLLTAVWARVVCLDLSPAMLNRSSAPWRIRADGARLPIASGSAAAVVVGDAPLFASEIRRALRSDGVLLWSNALGESAPHHVPVRELVAAMSTPDEMWSAIASDAGWGSWAVLRRR